MSEVLPTPEWRAKVKMLVRMDQEDVFLITAAGDRWKANKRGLTGYEASAPNAAVIVAVEVEGFVIPLDDIKTLNPGDTLNVNWNLRFVDP